MTNYQKSSKISLFLQSCVCIFVLLDLRVYAAKVSFVANSGNVKVFLGGEQIESSFPVGKSRVGNTYLPTPDSIQAGLPRQARQARPTSGRTPQTMPSYTSETSSTPPASSPKLIPQIST